MKWGGCGHLEWQAEELHLGSREPWKVFKPEWAVPGRILVG